MRIVASIQARMGSSRLPGKVLKPIHGKPMLLWQIERVRRSRLVDEVVVATTISPADDAIEDFCRQHGVLIHRGSEDDVLGRVAGLIRQYQVDIHVELCGDSPLTDPQIVDEFIGYYLKNSRDCDFVSSAIETTYPPGQEVIVYPGKVLVAVDELVDPGDENREHVGFNVTRFKDRFKVVSMSAPTWHCRPEVYLEVDTAKDLAVMDRLIGHFASEQKAHFSLEQILEVMDKHPDWIKENSDEERRWRAFRMDSDA